MVVFLTSSRRVYLATRLKNFISAVSIFLLSTVFNAQFSQPYRRTGTANYFIEFKLLKPLSENFIQGYFLNFSLGL
jgi:intein-encoded DNA endonuclease-like protein